MTIEPRPGLQRQTQGDVPSRITDDKSEYLTHIHLGDAGGSARQLTSGDKSCDDPQWSPDGAWLEFVSNRSGAKNLWLIPTDGGEAQQRTDFKADVSGFKWSPEGHSIAVAALDPPTAEETAVGRAKNDARVVNEAIKRYPRTPHGIEEPRLLLDCMERNLV